MEISLEGAPVPVAAKAGRDAADPGVLGTLGLGVVDLDCGGAAARALAVGTAGA